MTGQESGASNPFGIDIPVSVKAQFDLTGKVAVITGGAGYLGAQYADAIAEMGGVPVLADLNADALSAAQAELKANRPGVRCGTYVVDITQEDECEGTAAAIIEEYDRIDILINNAALTKEGFSSRTADFFSPFETYPRELWEDGMRVNLTGTMLVTKHVGGRMALQGSGSIINVASDVGVISPDHRIYQPDGSGYEGVPFNSPASYAVSKAGVIQLTRYLATYWAPKGVRVNAFSPGGVYRDHAPQFVKKLSECIPLGRMAVPNEYKGAIVFLASDASSFMTGANLVMDGGRTCW